MTPNDRLYDELLAPLVERYRSDLALLAVLPAGRATETSRNFYLGLLRAREVEGDAIAAILEVACPDWSGMQERAVAS